MISRGRCPERRRSARRRLRARLSRTCRASLSRGKWNEKLNAEALRSQKARGKEFTVETRSRMSRKKVTVVGGGFVGSTTAQRIVDMELADVALTDILDGPPAGKGLDMLESTPITGSDARVTGISTASGDYRETANSDVVVITAGFPRKPGMSRDDLLKANYEVIKVVVEQVAKYSPNAILIMVTNPLDAMVQVAYKVSGFSKNRVMGMAGVLDSARMSTF